jgi:acetyl esterase/lipase
MTLTRPHMMLSSRALVARISLGALCVLPCVTQACASSQTSPATNGPAGGSSNVAASGTPAPRPIVARAQPSMPLWTTGAPGALGSTPADQPVITPYLPPAGRANGTAVVVFPGGGYQHLSMEKEGSDVANWLASTGVTAFVVRYRLGPQYHHPTMLNDAQRAIRTVRARATEWGVDPRRIGIIGFSAGGHLASSAGTHFDAGLTSGDAIDRVSSRPDFMMLLYPVITMLDSSITHRGSRVNLLGENPDPALVRLMSNETQVTRETPPAFIVHSTDDRTVPVENALLMYQALRNAAVPVEMHVFEYGGHGFGLAPKDPILSSWTTAGESWMRRHGWLTPAH